MASRALRAHLDRMSALGCIVCRRLGLPAVPGAELHHPRFCAGMGQRASDWLVIPLCPAHHRTGGHGVALHEGRRTFEAAYGTEPELLAAALELYLTHLYEGGEW